MIGQMKYKRECAVCPTEVHKVVNGKLRKSDEYHEVNLKLSDLYVMKVAVCSQHTEPTKDQLAVISNKVKQGWMEEVAFGIGNEDWVKNVGLKIEVTGVAR
jgi:hypothetical protein